VEGDKWGCLSAYRCLSCYKGCKCTFPVLKSILVLIFWVWLSHSGFTFDVLFKEFILHQQKSGVLMCDCLMLS
jgi:hypothetical protein